MPLTAGPAFVIRSLTGGVGTAYHIESSGITGTRGFGIKSADTDLHFDDGVVASRDHKSARTITIPIIVRGAPLSTIDTLVGALETAWAPAAADINLELHTGTRNFTVSGRPRGLEVDETFGDGTARCLAIFLVTGG